jgi:uncharacterized protein
MIDPRDVDDYEIAHRGDTEVLEVFLEAGLETGLRDMRRYTLLMIAAYNDQMKMVELLLDHGADADGRDTSGITPVMGACFKGNVAMAECLLAAGADPEATDARGLTAADLARTYGTPRTKRRSNSLGRRRS